MQLRIDTKYSGHVYVGVQSVPNAIETALVLVRKSDVRQVSLTDNTGNRLFIVFNNFIGTELEKTNNPPLTDLL